MPDVRETQLRGPTQCERILRVLADRQPHRMEEIHQRAGFCRLNSRISDLRSRGYVIECDKSGGNYTYTLLAAPCEADGDRGYADPSTSSASQGAPAPCGTDGPPDVGAPEQLVLDSALTGAVSG